MFVLAQGKVSSKYLQWLTVQISAHVHAVVIVETKQVLLYDHALIFNSKFLTSAETFEMACLQWNPILK